MPGEQILLDPTAEGTGTQLDITDNTLGYWLIEHAYPTPEHDEQWAGSADTEGERRASTRPRNRTITVKVRCREPAGGTPEITAIVNDLQRKIAKLNREGGTLRRVLPSADPVTFDVLAARIQVPSDQAWVSRRRADVEMTFTCLPYGRGPEVDLGDNVETTSPALIFNKAAVPGDVDGRGRLLIDNDVAAHQWWLTWGIQSRYYSADASAALFYEAEGRTAMGGSATAAGPSGASGGGSNVMRNTSLLQTYQAILSTQASGGGAHLSHIGTFRVYARVQIPTTNGNGVTVALEWGQGDFLRYTRNAETEIPYSQSGKWRLVDLGLVRLDQVAAGTQRWEGRIIAKAASLGDDIDIDYLLLIPVDEGSGVVKGVAREFTPSAYSARDDFTGTTSGGALNGRTPVTGAAWATSGAATDFAFVDAGTPTGNLSEAVSRSVSSTSVRYGVFGPTLAAVEVRGRMGVAAGTIGGGGVLGGLLARWVDSSNHLRLSVNVQTGPVASMFVSKVVGGVGTMIAPVQAVPLTASITWPLYVDLMLRVDANGAVTARMYDPDGELLAELEGVDSALATGGTLDDGQIGIFDSGDGTNTLARWYDDISAAVPPNDSAVFASQSLEVRHDRVVREDSGGTLWQAPSSYEGDYLLVPPSGPESRTTRVVVKMARNDPLEQADLSIDDLSAKLFVTPRYLVVPDP